MMLTGLVLVVFRKLRMNYLCMFMVMATKVCITDCVFTIAASQSA